MYTMRRSSRPTPGTLVRGWECDQATFPYRTVEEWLALVKAAKEGKGLEQVIEKKVEKENQVTVEGMETLASILNGSQSAWQNGKWYRQALGCGDLNPQMSDTSLTNEIYRKGFTEFVISSRTVTSNTFFSSTDFASQSTTVDAGATTTTTFPLVSAGNLRAGDLIRVGLTTGYEFKRIGTIVGVNITLAAYDSNYPSTTGPLSAAPAQYNTVDQVIDEAGLFGDLPANYSIGTVALTNGSATITGTGTAWTSNLGATQSGKMYIALAADPRTWYQVASVDSDTQLTLSANFPGTTVSGSNYSFKGNMYNHVNGLQYVKLATKAFVFENTWTMGG